MYFLFQISNIGCKFHPIFECNLAHLRPASETGLGGTGLAQGIGAVTGVL